MRDRPPRRISRQDNLTAVFLLGLVDLAIETGFGIGPVAVRGGAGNAQDARGLLVGESGEATQLDQLGFLGLGPELIRPFPRGVHR